MLSSLTIQNFAIIDAISIDFTEGMTVLSGETGAGKSIIIDALGILIGGRGSTDLIRLGSDKLVVEGLFQINNPTHIMDLFDQYGLDWDEADESLIIRREINQNGKNTIRINGQLSNVTLLKEIGKYLVDIHGQNEHQTLLDKSQHLNLLDEFGENNYGPLLNEYQNAFKTYTAIRQAFIAAQKNETDNVQRLNFLEFQINEIEQYQLVAQEDEALEALSQKLQKSKEIEQTLASINYLFSESDLSLLDQLNQIIGSLADIKHDNGRLEANYQRLESLLIDLEDIAQEIALESSDNIDDQSLDEVESRLGQLSQIKRKYNMTISEILTYYDEISEEVYQIRHRDQYLKTIETELTQAYKVCFDLAEQLHNERQAMASEMTQAIEAELAALYMKNSRFKVDFTQVETDKSLAQILDNNWLKLSETGLDLIEFFVKTNVGEEFKPLIRVASGGELSRYMLALKAVFSQHQDSKTMVFDEIDTGVSGRVAQAIAEKIYSMSYYHQVLCITHLPQVAAIANQQLYIKKEVDNERTYTKVSTLDESERSEVIAQMMSGKVITQASLKLAKELLSELQNK
ncbi:DNA repair protein RecN [Fundicoccus culcitae]|uniref:DNA repair protein RecN n=1 Tax=Fundicoccus culcitae TaxID=2969821 RepID=A0ABY5P6M1_9LACT|nr:DNA repair protein RecN [Fundicoccus culcitae]UUX34255.1 DNA repair protein RecN [Fundicoccus culcitae]